MAFGGNGSALLESVRAIRPRILAERDRIESSRRLPDDLLHELAKAGFFRIYLPEAYGGLDLTPMQAMEVFEELARADASSHGACGTAILIGRQPNSRRRPHEPCTLILMSLRQIAHGLRGRRRSLKAVTE